MAGKQGRRQIQEENDQEEETLISKQSKYGMCHA